MELDGVLFKAILRSCFFFFKSFTSYFQILSKNTFLNELTLKRVFFFYKAHDLL